MSQVHLSSGTPAPVLSQLVPAPLVIWLMTCSLSCDCLRRSDFVLLRRFFHLVRSWMRAGPPILGTLFGFY